MKHYFPCALNISKKDCVVIGDDSEAQEKASRLVEAGGKVRRYGTNPGLKTIGEPFLIVFSDKEDKKTAKELFDYCEKNKILMCAIDQPDFCHVVNVSIVRKGALAISISTGGVSPAAAKKIRKGLEKSLENEPIDRFFDDLAALRKSLIESNLDPSEKRKRLIDAVKDFEFSAKVKFPIWLAIFGLMGLMGCGKANSNVLRIGYSPNLTHAHALVGLSQGNFQNAEGVVFHAGPSIIEAMFAGAIHVAYVGPVPAVNSYLRSGGKFVVIGGAANGGAAVVAARHSPVSSIDDLGGRRLATPQLGNTQDVTARATFLGRKPPSYETLPNPEHLVLFKNKNVDASWTVEPWVSRLIDEEGGRLIYKEEEIWKEWGFKSYPTTVILARKSFVEQNPDVIKKFLAEHAQLTAWITSHPEEAGEICATELARIQGQRLPRATIEKAWNNIEFTIEVDQRALERSAQNLWDVGFLRTKPGSLDGIK